jgi:hypothetical protein
MVQPAIETAVGAPLQRRERDDEIVVGYRDAGGEFRVLKRLPR